MKRVAAAPDPEQWKDIVYALTLVREARAARAYALRAHHRLRGVGPPKISNKDVETLKVAMKRVEDAIKSLSRRPLKK